jgi:hypothetical protein
VLKDHVPELALVDDGTGGPGDLAADRQDGIKALAVGDVDQGLQAGHVQTDTGGPHLHQRGPGALTVPHSNQSVRDALPVSDAERDLGERLDHSGRGAQRLDHRPAESPDPADHRQQHRHCATFLLISAIDPGRRDQPGPVPVVLAHACPHRCADTGAPGAAVVRIVRTWPELSDTFRSLSGVRPSRAPMNSRGSTGTGRPLATEALVRPNPLLRLQRLREDRVCLTW